MKKTLYILFFLASLIMISCEIDNYDEPGSLLTGRIVYNNTPLQLPNGVVALQLYQEGYQTSSSYISVYVAQDGTFSSLLFDGSYYMFVPEDVGPWINIPDSIPIKVSGDFNFDIEVSPYYIFSSDTFTYDTATDEITGSFKVEEITAGSTIRRAYLFLGLTTILDKNTSIQDDDIRTSDIDNGEGSISIALSTNGTFDIRRDIRAKLNGRDYVYARMALQLEEAEEYIYTAPQKITILTNEDL